MEMLGRADAIIAIQSDEAETVRRYLPDRTILTAPMAILPVEAAQPGHDNQLLFVGSNTAPNIVGLRWFVDNVWPIIRAGAPAAVLKVAGSVGDGFRSRPAAIEFLGRVDDLEPLYSEAGVVIAPLLQGSGLKIKLVEALGRGKAIVATPKTVQGVEDLVAGILPITEDAAAFATEVLELLHDPALRLRRAEAGLAVAREVCSAARCYETVNAFLNAGIGSDRGDVPDGGAIPGEPVQTARRHSRAVFGQPVLGQVEA
jgi:succinoglycan biosynthesis protein ExoO